jgi:drug/metabolite transporter (DMT)-like permease
VSLMTVAATIGTVLAIAVGQVLFKLAAGGAAGGGDFLHAVTNRYFVAALVVYGLATLAWVWILKSVPLSIAYPFMGLAFIIVPLLAWALLQEPIHWRHLVGGAMIMAGITVTSWK